MSCCGIPVFFDAQVRVRKSAAGAAHGPRSVQEEKHLLPDYRSVRGNQLLAQHAGRADGQEKKRLLSDYRSAYGNAAPQASPSGGAVLGGG